MLSPFGNLKYIINKRFNSFDPGAEQENVSLHGKGLLPENSSDLKLTFFANGFEHVPYTASSPLTKAALNKEFAGVAISTWVWQGATLPLKREPFS